MNVSRAARRVPLKARILRSSYSTTTHTWLTSHAKIANNAFAPAAATNWIGAHDPATDNIVTRVLESTDEEFQAAVKAAQDALSCHDPAVAYPDSKVTGTTPVLKPSERDSAAATLLAEIDKEAGFPNGVVNIIHGTHRGVDLILDEPSVRAISFVGGNAAGEYVYSGARPTGNASKPTSKPRATLLSYPAVLIRARLMLLVVPPLVMLDNVDELVSAAKQLKTGGDFEEGVDWDPAISPQSKSRIKSFIASAEEEGETFVLRSQSYAPEKYPSGNFTAPTIITEVKTWMKCYREETFGLVLLALAASTLEEAMEPINQNEYATNIAAGQIGVNVPIPVPLPMFSFTGIKKSVAGGGLSTFFAKPGLNFYTQIKTSTSLW
ncbi:Fc.00g058360.m01.CDS01 [Cosmosporella sp. VM-42]